MKSAGHWLRWYGVFLVVLHGLALGPLRGVLWGVDAYAFLPPAVFLIAVACLLAIAAWSWRRDRYSVSLKPLRMQGRSAISELASAVALGTVAAAIFFGFRVRHLLLGDGLPLTASAMRGEGFHPLEPLAMQMQVAVASWMGPVLSGEGARNFQSTWLALSLASAITGGIFTVVVSQVVRNFLDDRKSGTTDSPDGQARGALTLLILSQGYILVFFGYVENYALATLGNAFYLWLAVRHLRGRAPLLAPGLALLLAIGFHFSAVALGLSFGVLAVSDLRRSDSRRPAARDLVLLALAGALAVVVLRTSHPGYDPVASLIGAISSVATTAEAGARVVDARHIREVLNALLLVGPLGIVALLGFLSQAGRSPVRGRDPERAFFVVLGLTGLLIPLVAGDSNLGYARNWDLLSPWGFVTVAAGSLGLSSAVGAEALRGAIRLGLALSLFHTLPWIAVNASEAAALRRFETLPLGAGRVESTIGYWHALRGRGELAEQWLRRSVVVDSTNVRGWLFLGRLELGRGRNDQARLAFDRARRLRPELEEAWRGALLARWRTGEWAAAAALLGEAVELHPNSASLRAAGGIARALEGDSLRAARDLEAASSMSPDDPAIAQVRSAHGGAGRDSLNLVTLGDRLLENRARAVEPH